MALRDQLRVLVVDDMSTSRGLITQALEGLGIRNIATAQDGESALKTLETSPAHLVISDYNMPGIGFLLITGRADAAVIERGRALKMNNYIKKPFQPADLKAAIEAIVGRL